MAKPSLEVGREGFGPTCSAGRETGHSRRSSRKQELLQRHSTIKSSLWPSHMTLPLAEMNSSLERCTLGLHEDKMSLRLLINSSWLKGKLIMSVLYGAQRRTWDKLSQTVNSLVPGHYLSGEVLAAGRQGSFLLTEPGFMDKLFTGCY